MNPLGLCKTPSRAVKKHEHFRQRLILCCAPIVSLQLADALTRFASLRFVSSCTGVGRATENKSRGEFPYVLNKASARDSRSRSARRTLRLRVFSPLASREKISCPCARPCTCRNSNSSSNSSSVKILCCHCV